MRSVPEWIGKSDNEAIPARVKVRIFDKANGKCACCGVPIIGKIRPAYDHIIAICNGGANRENNVRLLSVQCHKGKSKADVAEKSKNYRVRAKHLGIKKPSRFPGSRDSKLKRKLDGSVVRR